MKVYQFIIIFLINFSIYSYDFLIKGFYYKNNLFFKTGILMNNIALYYGFDKNNHKEEKIHFSYNILYDYYGENFIDSIEGIKVGYLIQTQKKENLPMQFINFEYRFAKIFNRVNLYGNLYFIKSEEKIESYKPIFFKLENITNLDFYSYKIYFNSVNTLGLGIGSDYEINSYFSIGGDLFYYKLPKIKHRFDIFVDKLDYFYYKGLHDSIFGSLDYDYNIALLTALNNTNFFKIKTEYQFLKLRIYAAIKF
jgi:hypothetical protein